MEEARVLGVEASHIADLIRIAEETNLSPWTARSYLEEMKNDASIMLRLVAADNLTIGFVVGRLVMGGETEAKPDAEIYNIAVVRHEQQKGRGKVLFDAFAAICRDRRAGNVWLEVRESNVTAIRFYQKNGFARVQTRNHFYDNPREHAILMKLSLEKTRE